eukprot:10912917-Lingulodinium_polyedra.AAC.1
MWKRAKRDPRPPTSGQKLVNPTASTPMRTPCHNTPRVTIVQRRLPPSNPKSTKSWRLRP